MGEIVQFKKRKEPMQENIQKIFSELKAHAYKKLLPRGIAQSEVDGFMDTFEPIFLSMIPPPIVLSQVEVGDINYEKYNNISIKANDEINEFILKLIGETFHREMLYFLKDLVRQVKE